VLDAVRALEVASRPRDFYWTLASVFLGRREQFEIYDQAFHIFWRDPQLLERVMAMFCRRSMDARAATRRLPRPIASPTRYTRSRKTQGNPPSRAGTELDAAFSFSSREVLQHADFETMTSEEIAQAKKMLANLRLPIPEIRTGASSPTPRRAGRPAREPARKLENGAKIIPLKRRSPQRRHPPWSSCATCRLDEPLLADVSALLHAITNDRDRVTSFVFARGSPTSALPAPSRRGRRDERGVGRDRRLVGGTRIGNCCGSST